MGRPLLPSKLLCGFHLLPLQAQAEGTVTYVSNMWDTYFEGGRDHRLDRLSITQLPYYDGALNLSSMLYH